MTDHRPSLAPTTDLAWRPSAALGRRLALVVASGLAVGILTSFGQGHLDLPFNALVNSASAWLIVPFFVGSRMASTRGAAAAGLTVCALQLVGYYVTAELRGFPAGGAIVVFWAVCAIVGGPLFGAAGRLWRTGAGSRRGLGAAVLVAAFAAEGLWVYLHELHYETTAALWLAIALVLTVTMTRGWRERRWLALTVPAGLLAEIVLSQIYLRAF